MARAHVQMALTRQLKDGPGILSLQWGSKACTQLSAASLARYVFTLAK